MLERLNSINIPPLKECGTLLNKMERLKSYYYRLGEAPDCQTNDEALILINNVLVEIEDCHSGTLAEEMPGLRFSGRMYPIQEDYIIREENRIIARSKGNEIIIENGGDFIIKDRITDETIIIKTR
ncbi:hypothetical protein [Pedobacter sp. ok626]|uniref:hypothetical protein n=1 Tax=Pedobacter sp. ok626 TaxID=1761882 RepID=UPI000B85A171|nr:hypothetical protein [Pedobacter sp. ok626]